MNVKKFLSLSTAVAALAVLGASQAQAGNWSIVFTANSGGYVFETSSGNFLIKGTGTAVVTATGSAPGTYTNVQFTETASYVGNATAGTIGGHAFSGANLSGLSFSIGSLFAGSATTGTFSTYSPSGTVHTATQGTYTGLSATTPPLTSVSSTDSLTVSSNPTVTAGAYNTFTGHGSFTFNGNNPVPELSSLFGMGSLLVGGGLLGFRRRRK